MYYYKRNIGDYHKKAGRLTMLQHGAYTLLIDSCYDREVFPTVEDAIDWVWASSDDEVSAVKFVLKKFFNEINGTYVQCRIQDDLDKYHKMGETNKRIAVEREEKKRKSKTMRENKSTVRELPVNDNSIIDERLVNDTSPNQEPRTKNQEPRTKVQKTTTTKVAKLNYEQEDLNFAQWFYEQLLFLNPKQKKPKNFDKWANTIRIIRIGDDKTYQEMSDLFMWVCRNDFWKGNIQSPDKFRKQWDMLFIQMEKDLNKNFNGQRRDINLIGTDFSAPEGWDNE